MQTLVAVMMVSLQNGSDWDVTEPDTHKHMVETWSQRQIHCVQTDAHLKGSLILRAAGGSEGVSKWCLLTGLCVGRFLDHTSSHQDSVTERWKLTSNATILTFYSSSFYMFKTSSAAKLSLIIHSWLFHLFNKNDSDYNLPKCAGWEPCRFVLPHNPAGRSGRSGLCYHTNHAGRSVLFKRKRFFIGHIHWET